MCTISTSGKEEVIVLPGKLSDGIQAMSTSRGVRGSYNKNYSYREGYSIIEKQF